MPVRRDVLSGLVFSAALACGGRMARAQQRRARIAVLDWEANPAPERIERFRAGLREEGFIDGQNVTLDYRSAEGDPARARAIAEEFARGDHDVLVGFTTPAAHALREAERVRPIVFSVGDALSAGLVTNLSRPEANLTGVSNIVADLEAKRIELLVEMVPGMRRIAYLASTRDPAAVGFVRTATQAAERIGLPLTALHIEGPEHIDGALADARMRGAGAVIVQPIFTLSVASATPVAQALRRLALPAMGAFPPFARAGGLVAYGPAIGFALHRSARFVVRILRGARPGDLPVEQPTELLLVINLRAAQELGLAVSPLILARADEVIE